MADAAALEKRFEQWVAAVADTASDRVINIDTKCLRGNRKEENGSFIHMVSAWCNSSNMVLGQRKVYEKSNEITAIPALLEVLFIEGSTITIDTMGCQKNIAQKIVEGKADYILAVKGNREVLEDDLQKAFKNGRADDIFGGYFDTEFAQFTIPIFEKLNQQRFILLFSTVTENEFENAFEDIKEFVISIKTAQTEFLQLTDEVVNLATECI